MSGTSSLNWGVCELLVEVDQMQSNIDDALIIGMLIAGPTECGIDTLLWFIHYDVEM